MHQNEIKIIEMTFVNAFLIRLNDGFILIDCGLSLFLGKLEQELRSAGCLPGNLNLVIVTHGDVDHLGNCKILRDQYKCKIAMHQADTLMAEEGFKPIRTIKTRKAKIFYYLRRLFRPKITFDHFKPDFYLCDGQSLKNFGLDATVLHLPGHTKGSIGILTDDGNFFAGDILTNRKKPDSAMYIENASDLKNSMDKLKKLPLKVVYPGHGNPFLWEEIAQLI
jgi:hydroxyacylglutathione hydrolase